MCVVFSKNISYITMWVSLPMEWTGKNAAKNHLRLVIASIFIADLRLRDTHKSRFWNRRSFPVFSNNIMLSFYLAIPLYLPKCYELLVEVRLGSVRVGSVGSRIRFSHSYCLFRLLCLKSILPKCGWINFMLFDFLPNFKKQQTQKIKKRQIKKSNKSIGKKCGCQWMKLLLTLNRRVARVNEVALSDSVPLSQLKLNRAGQDTHK